MTKEQIFEHPPRGHAALLAYDSVNDRFQVVHVDANGLLQVDVAAQAANLDVNIAAQAVDVEVTQVTPADLVVAAHGYDGAAWRKQPLIWGYTGRFAESVGGTKSGAGDYFQAMSTVPAGEVWKVEFLSLGNFTGARGTLLLQLYNGAAYLTLQSLITPATGQVLSLSNPFTMKAGDTARVYQYSCVDADQLLGAAVGYKMSIAM